VPAVLVATLHQIAAIDKIPKEAAQAIRAVAYLLDKMDEGAIASTAREAVNDQLLYMNDELKNLTAHTSQSDTKKHMAVISASTKGLTTSSNASYRDILLGGNTTAPSMDPRLLAREGIKA